MNNNTIDKMYGKLMDSTQLSDNDVDEISKVLEEQADNNPEVSKLREILDGNIPEDMKEEDIHEKQVFANICPVTGKIINVLDKKPESNTTLDDYINALDDVEAEDFELTDEAVFNAVKNSYGPELPDSDIVQLVDIINRYRKEEYSVKYKDLPQTIQTKISKTIIEATDNSGTAIYVGNTELKNQMAKEFIDAIVQESLSEEISKSMIDLQTMINDYSKTEISKLYSSATIRQRDILENKSLEIAKSVEDKDPKKAEILRRVSYMFKQSYTYEDMYNMCKDTGKLRVKKIELEKCNKIYRDFNLKYQKTKNVIKNIEFIEPILDRHLPDYIDMEYIRKFIIVFCKYTQNMNPENITDHIFMYYFITNITSLDLFDPNNKEDKEFYDTIIANIEKFIDLIKLREGKK